jgi:hypothetical protein
MKEEEFKESIEQLKTTGSFSLKGIIARRIAAMQPGDNDVVQTFNIHGVEQRKINEWLADHDKVCPLVDPANQGAIGGRFAYLFCHTMLGTVVKVQCGCGIEFDASDYEGW